MTTVQKNEYAPGAPEATATVSRPNPQVTQRAPRRSFPSADKLRILAEADACKHTGQLGALLRREGLCPSTLANFRKQRDEGKLGKDPAQVRQQRLDKEAARLEAENNKLKVLIELQKKWPSL
jgi:transposase